VALSVICGYCYTGGPYPISYLGLSEIFIFIFYGGVCVIVPYYAQTYQLNWQIIVAAIQMGLLAILPNALNNFRDITYDAAANKKTLAVRFGRKFAAWELTALVLVPFVINIIWSFVGYAAMMMPFQLIPLVYFFIRAVWRSPSGQVLNRYFGLSVLIHFLFGLLLIAGIMVSIYG